jgi:hypothetical protein
MKKKESTPVMEVNRTWEPPGRYQPPKVLPWPSIRLNKPAICPVCRGLECLCRPRYFSGQLLTEAELNAEQAYTIKKNRLHNLYLHGWGVVCGMEVVCHPSCQGWVRVQQGYAISPCGDDIIVCDVADLDVMKAIKDCRKQSRQPQDCQPYARHEADCASDGCWYLMIRYSETATRAITALRSDRAGSAPACSCGTGHCSGCDSGCGCGKSRRGGNGNGYATHGNGANGCGCGKVHAAGGSRVAAASQASSATATMARAAAGAACEPTRVCEGFELSVCRAPEKTRVTELDLLGDTLLGQVYECLFEVQQLLAQAPDEDAAMKAGRVSMEEAKYGGHQRNQNDDCCRWLARVREFFETHPLTNCSVLDELDRIQCPSSDDAPVMTPAEARAVEEAKAAEGANAAPPGPSLAETGIKVAQYSSGSAVMQVRRLLSQYVIDCVCSNLLPPCPTDPGDDRLLLACVEVRGDSIDRICNWEGRKLAITMPAVRHWLSAFPVETMLRRLVERLCCADYSRSRVGGFGMERYAAYDAGYSGGSADELRTLALLAGLVGPMLRAAGGMGD